MWKVSTWIHNIYLSSSNFLHSFFWFKYGKKWTQSLGDMFKRKKLSAMPTLNNAADPSTNVVDQSVDSSASTTLMPEVNIITATTGANEYCHNRRFSFYNRSSSLYNFTYIKLRSWARKAEHWYKTSSCWPTFSAKRFKIWFLPLII